MPLVALEDQHSLSRHYASVVFYYTRLSRCLCATAFFLFQGIARSDAIATSLMVSLPFPAERDAKVPTTFHGVDMHSAKQLAAARCAFSGGLNEREKEESLFVHYSSRAPAQTTGRAAGAVHLSCSARGPRCHPCQTRPRTQSAGSCARFKSRAQNSKRNRMLS